jgi:hypothetical protein
MVRLLAKALMPPVMLRVALEYFPTAWDHPVWQNASLTKLLEHFP